MSSRYPPSSGYNPRDRSPQRFGDRRPPAGPRGSDDANLPIGREPPRAPKALIDPPRGAPFGGRGRGYYPGRGDFRDRDRDPRDRDRERDRDFRDLRDGPPPPFRRDIDRDWGRRTHDFDPREPRVGFGRGRSRSPPPLRDFRDMREPLARDPDMVRMRRGSRDSLMSVSSTAPDGPLVGTSHHPRAGPIRGRGRGEWEAGRGRGRLPYMDDRDSFRRRSRSRDARDVRWDRERERERERERDRERVLERDRERERIVMDRDRDRELDRRERERDREFDRREELDRRVERDDRDRPADLWKRDPPRVATRLESPATQPFHPLLHPYTPREQSAVEHPRKLSGDSWRDPERSEPLPPAARPDAAKEFLPPVVKRSPPPAAPQVPAFGTVTAPIPDLSTEKSIVDVPPPTTSLPKAEKDRHEHLPRPPMQPPTGPKADRGPPQHALDQRPRRDEPRGDESGEGSVKLEGPARTLKPQPIVTGAPPKPADLSPPTAPAAMVAAKEPAVTPESSPSKSSTAVVPMPDEARALPLAGRSTSPVLQTSPRMHATNIPTGPRALQQRPATSRGPAKSNKQWVRPGYNRLSQSGPSPTITAKRDSIDNKDRGFSISEESKRETKAPDDDPPAALDVDEMDTSNDVTAPADKEPIAVPELPAVLKDRVASPQPPSIQEAAEKPAGERNSVLIPDFGRSSDEDEDENVFTPEYLEERKKIFEKDMKALRAELPPPPLEDPTVVSLLMRIQLLGMIAHERMPTKEPTPQPPPDAAAPIKETEIAPPVEFKSETKKTEEDQEPPTKMILDSLPDALSIEHLPFLNSGPPTPISDLDIYHENSTLYENVKDMFRGELVERRKEIAKKNTELRMDYLSYYKPWRINVWELDRAKDRRSSVTPGPTPPPAPSLTVTPTPVPEGRRYKGNSELDFQNALRASEISAQEELERRRENKATAQPDLTREAVIPDMLDPREAKARIYKDTNNIVDPAQAMDVFAFLPPPNDFTPEEHEIFTDAFMAYPKKWGKIAEALPKRDFRECIVHYYLTKEEIKYKAKLNKRWSRRGRAKRSARPKSNALMADLGVVKPDYDGEEEPTPVTDTGRPRRAAAPTFGDSSADTEQSGNGRRGNAARDGEQGEKPAGRRGPRSGAGTRGGRRGKAAQQQQQQAPQTPQPEQLNPTIPAAATVVASSTTIVTPIPKTEILEPSVERASETAVRPKESTEREQIEAPPRAKSGRGRQKEGMYVFESTEPDSSTATPTATTRQSEVNYSSPQPTSYWSVPEQRDFPLLLAHFGRDFEGISNFMKTKTTVMVKNYFQRRIDSGQKDFEDIVADAEAKKARGEATGHLPMPNFTSKRRYEATPSSIIMPRPLAPNTEATPEVDDARLAPKSKHTGPPAQQQVPLHARPIQEKERSISRYPPLAQASSAPIASHSATGMSEEGSRAARGPTGIANRIPGPRLGYFPDDRRDITGTVLTHTAARPQEVPMSARQAAISGPDMTRMEPLHGQGFRSSNVDMHGSPLLPGQSAAPSQQQPYMQSRAQSQAQPPPALKPAGSHSRQSSLTKPASPRHEAEISPIRRDSVGQRPYYPLPGQHVGISQPPILSPSKEPTRMGPARVEPPEPPRQVPAKRSNIMSILNDEPEEPQPRKRFASDQPPVSATVVSPSRSVYASSSSSLAQPPPARSEEVKGPVYAQQSQYLPPSRHYSDYPSYSSMSGGSGTAADSGWMARFDPRGQQQPQPPPGPPAPNNRTPAALAPQPPYSPYTSSQSLSGPTLPNLSAPSPAPTLSPAPSQLPSYSASVYAQSPAPHTQVADSRSRDLTSQAPMYRSTIGSPTQRGSGGIAYSSRPGASTTPMQTSVNALGVGSRQPAPVSSYASTAPPTPASMTGAPPQQLPGGPPQGYPHAQPMVGGLQQPQPHRSLGLMGAQYGHNTPPPPSQLPGSRVGSLAGSGAQQMSMGRSYTPPALLQPNPVGGMGYGPGGPAPAVGSVHPLQARAAGPGSLGEAVPGPHGASSHHRVYSQGSNAGPLPGPLNPQHPAR
ncbi:hypothetical protein ARAM_006685 [Aspergillus rambellii]|uniref:SANT domain-containing protein n=1 Tax=Aspergillus rambellii TaxID=308745 RepID=A0A0F8UXS2_9EURO|nr:hypothetical protein ARAM_006685 [Aspergillus rambellii]